MDEGEPTQEPTAPRDDGPATAFSLENILGEHHDVVEGPTAAEAPLTGWDEESGISAPEGFCVECEGTYRALHMSSY